MAETKYLDEVGVRHLIGKVKSLHESGVTGIRINGGTEQHGVVDIDTTAGGDIIVGDMELEPITTAEIESLFDNQ